MLELGLVCMMNTNYRHNLNIWKDQNKSPLKYLFESAVSPIYSHPDPKDSVSVLFKVL